MDDNLRNFLYFFKKNSTKIKKINFLIFSLVFIYFVAISKNKKLHEELRWETEYKTYFFGIHLFENEQWPNLKNYVYDVLHAVPLKQKIIYSLRTDELYEDLSSLYYVYSERNSVFLRIRTLKENGNEVSHNIANDLKERIANISSDIKYAFVSGPTEIVKDPEYQEQIVYEIKKKFIIKRIYLFIFYILSGFILSCLYLFFSEKKRT